MTGPLDTKLSVTYFADKRALSARNDTVTLRQFSEVVLGTSAPTKHDLPWVKLAVFGDTPSRKGSYRHDANVVMLSGIEADYDAEVMTPAEAVSRLSAARLAALVYTSPSHRIDRPRWRVLCPLSEWIDPRERRALVGRLNGVLGGTLSLESFTLSQAYYYGHVDGSADHGTWLVDGRYIDEAPELAAGALYPVPKAALTTPRVPPGLPPDEHVKAAVVAATGAFGAPEAVGQMHPTLLAATLSLAPYVLSGHLDEADAMAAVSEAMEDAGRTPNPGEVESAMKGALAKAQPYEPPTGGSEFGVVPLSTGPEDPDAWRSMLRRMPPRKKGEEGPIKSSLENTLIALRHAPAWRGIIALDAFSMRVMFTAKPPIVQGVVDTIPREMTDADVTLTTEWMQAQGIGVSSLTVGEAVFALASAVQFNPARRYFESLVWDGVPRIDTWLTDHLGAADTPLNRAFAARFLISAVARVFKPGCQVDTTLIAEGAQGIGKSSAFRCLAGDWFTDHMPDLHSKDAALQIQGMLITEHAEMATLRFADAGRVKAFMTTRVDRLRPPFGRKPIDYPRQGVFVATVNPGGSGYLKDDTGGRRFWPVLCGETWPKGRTVDVGGLAVARDQLWAEAVARYAAGESWWLDTAELQAAQEQSTEARYDEDVWTAGIAAFVEGRPYVTVSDILDAGGPVPVQTGMRDRSTQMRVSSVLKVLGWTKRPDRINNKLDRYKYYPPVADRYSPVDSANAPVTPANVVPIRATEFDRLLA